MTLYQVLLLCWFVYVCYTTSEPSNVEGISPNGTESSRENVTASSVENSTEFSTPVPSLESSSGPAATVSLLEATSSYFPTVSSALMRDDSSSVPADNSNLPPSSSSHIPVISSSFMEIPESSTVSVDIASKTTSFLPSVIEGTVLESQSPLESYKSVMPTTSAVLSSEIQPSASIMSSLEEPLDESAVTSDVSTSIEMMSSTLSPTPASSVSPPQRHTTPSRRTTYHPTPSNRRLMIVLRGNCSQENLTTDLEHAFSKLLNNTKAGDISVTEIHCSTLLDVNVTLSAGEMKLKQLIKNLGLSRNLPVGEGTRHFFLTDFSVREDSLTNRSTSVRHRWAPTDDELIIYIVVGVFFGVVSVIAFIICMIKCCRRQPSKTLDFLDTPHLNLRLEDYTLTRIPRPHTIYADHLRSPTSENGGPISRCTSPRTIQNFDTSIIPLEDAPPPPPRLATVPISDKHDRQGLKTFGKKPAPARPPDDHLHRQKLLSGSKERLTDLNPEDRQGVDNPTYVPDVTNKKLNS